ncbi:MAG: DUF3187 family protein [Gemmatimonadota bacterium]
MPRQRSKTAFHLALGLILVIAPARAMGQSRAGLPSVFPVNPMAEARTGLYFQPYQDLSPGWRASASLAYGSLIELNQSAFGQYLLDGEVGRLDLSLGRDLGPRIFARLDAGGGSAAAGFMDGFFNWYHQLFGLHMPEREMRPLDAFGYQMDLPDGISRARSRGFYLNDLRVSVGRRHSDAVQSIFSVTLPVSSGESGYGKGVPSFALITTARKAISSRLLFEGSLGFGSTPRHGDLSPFQRQEFMAGTSGFRFRTWGRQSLFVNFLYHSPYYEHTNFPALDRKDLSLNYGWILRTRSGREWVIGMTEDLAPSGPAIDAVFQISSSWNLP